VGEDSEKMRDKHSWLDTKDLKYISYLLRENKMEESPEYFKIKYGVLAQEVLSSMVEKAKAHNLIVDEILRKINIELDLQMSLDPKLATSPTSREKAGV
jgi:hypothetical protein